MRGLPGKHVKDRVGRKFLTTFTLRLMSTPSDWALNLSRFVLEAIVSESGRRAKSINFEIEDRKSCVGDEVDELFAPMQTGKVPDEAQS